MSGSIYPHRLMAKSGKIKELGAPHGAMGQGASVAPPPQWQSPGRRAVRPPNNQMPRSIVKAAMIFPHDTHARSRARWRRDGEWSGGGVNTGGGGGYGNASAARLARLEEGKLDGSLGEQKVASENTHFVTHIKGHLPGARRLYAIPHTPMDQGHAVVGRCEAMP